MSSELLRYHQQRLGILPYSDCDIVSKPVQSFNEHVIPSLRAVQGSAPKRLDKQAIYMNKKHNMPTPQLIIDKIKERANKKVSTRAKVSPKESGIVNINLLNVPMTEQTQGASRTQLKQYQKSSGGDAMRVRLDVTEDGTYSCSHEDIFLPGQQDLEQQVHMLEKFEIPTDLAEMMKDFQASSEHLMLDTQGKRNSIYSKTTGGYQFSLPSTSDKLSKKLNIPYYRKVMKVPLTLLKNELHNLQEQGTPEKQQYSPLNKENCRNQPFDKSATQNVHKKVGGGFQARYLPPIQNSTPKQEMQDVKSDSRKVLYTTD